jgi:hypothetical protein
LWLGEDGIVERGTHPELISQHGIMAKLYEASLAIELIKVPFIELVSVK